MKIQIHNDASIPILFEDDALLVVNKPAGVVVNRSETAKEKTVQDWVEGKFRANVQGEANSSLPLAFSPYPLAFVQRAGIVHRLDKETSGCLIVAKTPEAFAQLQRQFQERTVQKEYIALVHGMIEPKEGTIRVPILRSRGDRRKFAVLPGGRIAETRYATISTLHRVDRSIRNGRSQQLNLTLLRLFPKTGRTHQIRVHLVYIGHPIVSDTVYAGEKRSRADRAWCPRMFLHAQRITFRHPVDKRERAVEAPLPEDLGNVLQTLSR